MQETFLGHFLMKWNQIVPLLYLMAFIICICELPKFNGKYKKKLQRHWLVKYFYNCGIFSKALSFLRRQNKGQWTNIVKHRKDHGNNYNGSVNSKAFQKTNTEKWMIPICQQQWGHIIHCCSPVLHVYWEQACPFRDLWLQMRKLRHLIELNPNDLRQRGE